MGIAIPEFEVPLNGGFAFLKTSLDKSHLSFQDSKWDQKIANRPQLRHTCDLSLDATYGGVRYN